MDHDTDGVHAAPALTAPARPARYFMPVAGREGRFRCTLCPRGCVIGEAQAGFCHVRQVHGGTPVSVAYGRPTGFAVDPIEKKPLYHVLPGSPILSFGTVGCNLGCVFCQNWSLSKARPAQVSTLEASADDVVRLALARACPTIAMTYNEPIVFAEYAIDVTTAARAAGLDTVLVTAGYVTAEARGPLFSGVLAANVDLKAFTDGFYRRFAKARLTPVLDTLRYLVHETDVWVEVTTLLIPGLNDSDDEIRALATWMVAELHADVPLHLSAFHPDFELLDRPATPPATLRRARAIAREAGLRHVYTGNVRDREGASTICPSCGVTVVEREGFAVLATRLAGGCCSACGAHIAGRWLRR